ncbi:hypothetical protein GALMADRAFT_244849, partial [Galerina marginata CBS 339.88]
MDEKSCAETAAPAPPKPTQLVGAHLRVPSTMVGRRARLLSAVVAVGVVVASQYRGLACSF